jgi:hypothetical protein
VGPVTNINEIMPADKIPVFDHNVAVAREGMGQMVEMYRELLARHDNPDVALTVVTDAIYRNAQEDNATERLAITLGYAVRELAHSGWPQ